MDIDSEVRRFACVWIQSIIVTFLAFVVLLGVDKLGLLPDGAWGWWTWGLFIAILLLLMGVAEAIRTRVERARADRLRRADADADRAGEGFSG